MKQPKIHYEILEDETSFLKEFLEEYWQNISGKFVFRVEDLRCKYEMNSQDTSAFVSDSNAYLDFGNCNCCGGKNITDVKNRSRAIQVLSNLYYYFFYSTCRDKANKFCKNLDEYNAKIIWMRLSFKYKLWNELDKDEMNFLKAIYFLKQWNRIYHEVIVLDSNYGFGTLEKLDKMNLIYYYKDDFTGQINILMLEGLQNLIKLKKI